MDDNYTDTAVVTQAVDYWYSPTLLVRAVSNFVHTRWAQVRDIPRNSGDDIKFRRYGNLSAATTPLTEGVTPSGSQLSITDVLATVAQYGDFVTITDKLSFTTYDPLLDETADILGDQAGDTIDQLTRTIMVAGTTIQYASTAAAENQVTAVMVLNSAEVREAVMTLQVNKAKVIKEMIDPMDAYNTVPLGKCYVGIIHPKTLRDLKNDTGFVPVQKYPRQTDVMEDEQGAVDNVRFVMSPNAYVGTGAGSGGADVYRTLIIGRDFYGITRITGETLRNIVKPLGSAGTADPLEQRATSGWKVTFVAKILNNAFGVVVYHGATA